MPRVMPHIYPPQNLFCLFLTGVTHWSVKTCSERGSSIKGPEEYVSYNNATHNISSTVTSTHRETAYKTQPVKKIYFEFLQFCQKMFFKIEHEKFVVYFCQSL